MSTRSNLGVRIARAWVDCYTRGLPEPAGTRRRDELESDIWEQTHDPHIGSRGVLGRCVRGIPADVWWRYRTLLESRTIRERSRGVFNDLKRNWWEALVATTAVLGAVSAATTPLFTGDLQDEHLAFALAATVIGLVSSGLLVGGLVLLGRNRVAGSRLILAGTVPALIAVLAVNPISLLAVAVVASGLWTGNLQLGAQPADTATDAVTLTRPRMSRWYLWIAIGAVLFAIGFGALIVGDLVDGPNNDRLTETMEGLIYFAWVFSWASAAASGAIGAVLGIISLASRHRTRPA